MSVEIGVYLINLVIYSVMAVIEKGVFERDEYLDHNLKFLVLLFFWYLEAAFLFSGYDWAETLFHVVSLGFVYSIYFDSFLNVIRGKPFYHLGQDWIWDRIWSAGGVIGFVFQLLIKVFIVAFIQINLV